MAQVPKALQTILNSLCFENNLTSWKISGANGKISMFINFTEGDNGVASEPYLESFRKKSVSQMKRDQDRKRKWEERATPPQSNTTSGVSKNIQTNTEGNNIENQDIPILKIPVYIQAYHGNEKDTQEGNLDVNNIDSHIIQTNVENSIVEINTAKDIDMSGTCYSEDSFTGSHLSLDHGCNAELITTNSQDSSKHGTCPTCFSDLCVHHAPHSDKLFCYKCIYTVKDDIT